MRSSDEFEPIFLAKGGPPLMQTGSLHSGTYFGPVNADSNQYFFYTDGYDFDFLYGTIKGKEFYTKFFNEFLLVFQPDVVHFQHTLHLGYDLIRQARNTLPNVPILYTLHEFLPICHRQGQMIRTNNDELCNQESPRRCHECFPSVSPQDFFMRKRFALSHLSLVDLFLAPSHFLLERYVEWGIPREKIRFEDYGRRSVDPIAQSEANRPRTRVGFFGQISVFKGVKVLMEAMKLLSQESSSEGENDAHLWLYGANRALRPCRSAKVEGKR